VPHGARGTAAPRSRRAPGPHAARDGAACALAPALTGRSRDGRQDQLTRGDQRPPRRIGVGQQPLPPRQQVVE